MKIQAEQKIEYSKKTLPIIKERQTIEENWKRRQAYAKKIEAKKIHDGERGEVLEIDSLESMDEDLRNNNKCKYLHELFNTDNYELRKKVVEKWVVEHHDERGAYGQIKLERDKYDANEIICLDSEESMDTAENDKSDDEKDKGTINTVSVCWTDKDVIDEIKEHLSTRKTKKGSNFKYF